MVEETGASWGNPIDLIQVTGIYLTCLQAGLESSNFSSAERHALVKFPANQTSNTINVANYIVFILFPELHVGHALRQKLIKGPGTGPS